MIENAKALTFVLALAICVFWITRPVMLHYTSKSDLTRRHCAWLLLTSAAFLSPSFWLYVLIAVPVYFWAGRKDSNPVAFYLLLLQVIPQIPIYIPVVGIKNLFELDNYRLLALCVLLPAAFRTPKGFVSLRRYRLPGLLILAYGALTIWNRSPYTSFTDSLRGIFLFLIDTYLLYKVVRRWSASRQQIIEALASLFLGCAIMAAIGTFESAKHWLLYELIQQQWVGTTNIFYLSRAGMLRPSASSGNVLVLGFLLAIGVGIWLNIGKNSLSAVRRTLVWLLLIVGLIVTYSRGPWIGAVVIAAIWLLSGNARPILRPRTIAVGALIAICLILSPLGARVIHALPFMGGTEGADTFTYRQRLLDRSLDLIKEHPLFGNQLVLFSMEDLRQGMGMIDIVNSYIAVALFNGLIGLVLFLGPILTVLLRLYREARKLQIAEPETAALGSTLVSCIVGTLVMLATCSFIFGYTKIYYVLIAMSAGYVMSVGKPLPMPGAIANSNLGASR